VDGPLLVTVAWNILVDAADIDDARTPLSRGG
jgi:hypothetical protein